jgi:murein DD-endopeptidase MepM/ murein hydrolase activator NlpD
VPKRSPFGLALASLLLATASAGASGLQSATGGAAAHAYAIKVVVPGQAGGATPTVSAPPSAVQFSGSFSYGDAGAVTAGATNASVTAVAGTNASASATAEVDSLSLFGGEITASSVVVHAQATAKPSSATGDAAGSTVTNLVALGQPVETGGSVALADWGSLHTIESGSSNAPSTGYHGFVTGVDIRLTADHGGLPAGTSILVGYADVSAQAAPPAPTVKTPRPRAKSPKPSGAKPPAAPRSTSPSAPSSAPLTITPGLHTPGGHVFPVYGPSSFTDTYGAGRSDVPGGWHHGDDIFAPLGAPILAVASGTVFSVGWNSIGGNRLWLRDGAGNEYYYAHLSAYTPLARNGNSVRVGDVLGFVGNTGDAQTTPYHLHFEVHPVSLLGLGYNGAVDPTDYLSAWKHLQDVGFAGGIAWAPLGHSVRAPKPGAILISATDISTANGLDPGSLERVVRSVGIEGTSRTASARPQKRKPAAGQRAAAGRTH